MAEPSPQSNHVHANAPASFVALPAQDEGSSDIAFGFECANPWLQIESWDQEGPTRATLFR